MIELLLVAAKVMPEGEIINEIKNGIEEYESGNTKDGLNKITMFGMMLGAKQSMGEGDDGLMKMMQATNRMGKLDKLITFPES